MRARAVLWLTAVSLITPSVAHAGEGEQLRGFIEFGAAVADGEDSWIDEGFGKTRFSGDEDIEGWARGILLWRPQLGWNLDGYVTLAADTQLNPVVDVIEAYVNYRGAPSQGWRLSGRAGVFYPPISLEHDGPAWTTTQTITPSAINSWISEEVKVVGAEASARRRFGEQELTATLALFGYNDTSGTLLAFRGWALGDVMAGVSSEMELPQRSFAYQEDTRPTFELDDRIGYYAQVQYRPTQNVTTDLLFYDNRGDRISDSDGQTNWETRFLSFGARVAFDEDTRLLTQVMSGRTIWGYRTPLGYWVDVDFNAAYLLLARDIGSHRLSGRVDYFEIGDRSFADVDNNDEEGWAATAAYQIELSPTVRLAVEGMHISSDRPSRIDQGVDPDQDQSVLQTSVELSF
jgi:hypothetical protein